MSKLFEFSQEPEHIIVDRVLIKVNKVIEQSFPELATSNEFSSNDATATIQTDPLEKSQAISKVNSALPESDPVQVPKDETTDQLAETRKLLNQNHEEIRSSSSGNMGVNEAIYDETEARKKSPLFLILSIILLIVVTAIIASVY